MPLVLPQFGREERLVSNQLLVDEVESRYPIAVFNLSISLNVVLPSDEVPKEIAPLHVVDLIVEEEGKVLSHRGDGERLHVTALVVFDFMPLYSSGYPLVI